MTAGFRGSYDGVVFTSSRRTLQYVNNNDTTIAAPPPWMFSSNSTRGPQREGSYFSRSFNSNVVVVMAVLLFALVVAAFINTVARCVLRRRRPQPPDEHAAVEKGLEKSAIAALPVVAYGAESVKALFDPAGGNECVVCLSEFVNGERLRLLPDCQHGFHIGCIDTWLLTHVSCPVCRRSVLPASTPPGCGDDSDDPACASRSSAIASTSPRFGSSRFGSARIASVGIEIEPSGSNPNASTATATTDQAGTSSGSTRPSKWSFASMLSTETMVNIIHSASSHRFGSNGRFGGNGRSQGQV